MPVEMTGVLVQNGGQVTFTDDEHCVGALAAYAADPALGYRVRPRCPRRCLDHLDVLGGEYGVEPGGELGITVAKQEPQARHPLVQRHQEIPGLLGHPGVGGMGGHAEDVDLTGGQFDEEEHIDSLEEHRVDGEQVAGQDGVGLQVRNWRQVGPARRGAGSTLARLRIFHTVLEATVLPRPTSSAWMRRWPQVGFSAASRRTRSRICWDTGGRPDRECG